MVSPAEEQGIIKFWQEQNVFGELQKKNHGKPRWSFLDGPITANNPMGVHHAWGRTLKDLYQRYKAMRGFDQRFQNGFDCQGLWVEVEVEKALGFKSKRDIEAYGMEKFAIANRERVEKFAALQTEQSIRLGQWMDWEHSYFTMSERNNEFIWRFLKKCHENGWLYKGVDSVPWCPRCGTAISHHELSDGGYAMLKHPSVYVKFPLVDDPTAALLIWTTTPWTLLANVAAAVKVDATYVKVRAVQGSSRLGSNSKDDNYSSSEAERSREVPKQDFILLKSRIGVLGPGWAAVEEFPGSKLVGQKYEGPFDHIEKSKVEHHVVAWDEVSEADGSGIVHIAPGCGKEDHELGKRENLPAIAPLDEFGVYLPGFGSYSGKFAGDVAPVVIADLKKRGLLFAAAEEEHSYPICWRCKTPLLFRLSGEWFISAKEIRPRMMQAAQSVQWQPSYALDRMLDWLSHMGDWPISRRRYWGLALPFYQCECGELTVIGSKEELRQRAIDPKLVDGLPELHRPWIDAVQINCPKCGKPASRVPEVGDCWLDAGITPFSTLPGDPWAPKDSVGRKEWEQWFPAEFVCEGMSQIKLWFYTLLFMSVTLEDVAPYTRVMAFMNVVDANGEPMHKSKGNAIWFDDAIEKMGADVMRWIYASGSITNNLKFGFEIGEEVRRKFLVLDNVVKFYELFGRTAEITSNSDALTPQHILDQWMHARLFQVVDEVTKALDEFEHWKAAAVLEKAIDDLSTWYIRRSRERFKTSHEAASVLGVALKVLTQLLAPLIPFTAEALYQRLVLVERAERKEGASVHLDGWPDDLPKQWKNSGLVENMGVIRQLAELAHAARARAGLKLRQPLHELKIQAPGLTDKNDFLEVLRDEVNVKTVTVVKDIEGSDGWEVEKGTGLAIALDTRLTAQLKDEGIVRELIRQLNALRKRSGLTPSDRVAIEVVSSSPSLLGIFEHHREEILRGAIAGELRVVGSSALPSSVSLTLEGATLTMALEKIFAKG